jgi:hypothetical protein
MHTEYWPEDILEKWLQVIARIFDKSKAKL